MLRDFENSKIIRYIHDSIFADLYVHVILWLIIENANV